jgi:hypothetical protein
MVLIMLGPLLLHLLCVSSSDSFTLTVNSHRVVLKDQQGLTLDAESSETDDCASRKNYFCYADGQLMINIPRSKDLLGRSNIKVWVNYDVDDSEENERLGTPYRCENKG